jgi:hypothetical protein
MPARAALLSTASFVDEYLLDDEFDGFDVAPAYDRKPGVGHNLVLCDGMEFDEADAELE